MYCEHRFDLLGSGWVKNSYCSKAIGVEGNVYNMNVKFELSSILLKSHIKKSKVIFDLIDDDYIPIDWQKDFKSGYRWSSKIWHLLQRYGHKTGIDIKVPWELSRMQHLTQLAIFSLLDARLKERNIKEFKNQILDFIATNPPRMGVNWDAMEAGIRIVNWLITFDIFRQLDNKNILDSSFKQIFSNSIYEHALYISNNLERSEELTSNHYLSNLIGLLFAAAYLPEEERTSAWLVFSINEFIKEMDKQFYDDGGNFESSSSYHRLSGEIMIFATAIINNFTKTELPDFDFVIKGRKLRYYQMRKKFRIELKESYLKKLFKIGQFTYDITKPNGEIVQFGDNDSGRLVKLSPVGKFITNFDAEKRYLNLRGYNNRIKEYEDIDGRFWDENVLNHSTLIGMLNGLFNTKNIKSACSFEESLINCIVKERLNIEKPEYVKPEIIKYSGYEKLVYENKNVFRLKNKINTDRIRFMPYPDSGIYIFKSEDFHMAVCATPLGQNGYGGHAHNDKLSFEMYLDGEIDIKDPGTYLYTTIIDRRNEFRSIHAHNVPVVNDIEQNEWKEGISGVFRLKNNAQTYLQDVGENFIELILIYKGITIVRKFIIKEDHIIVSDKSNKDIKYEEFDLYSNGYGKLQKRYC